MDSIGDYIYLIIIIIAALSGIFKKKKPQAVYEPSEDEEEEVDYEKTAEIKEPLFPQKNVEEKYKNYEVNYQPLSFDNATDFSKLRAQKQVTITSIFNNTNDTKALTNEEEHESVYKFENLDDLKRAVIYTEIFNRKY